MGEDPPSCFLLIFFLIHFHLVPHISPCTSCSSGSSVPLTNHLLLFSCKPRISSPSTKGEKMKEMVGGCCVCSDESGSLENPLVYCDGDGCNVAVHQACYGIITVPQGPWFCKRCESQERAARVVSVTNDGNKGFTHSFLPSKFPWNMSLPGNILYALGIFYTPWEYFTLPGNIVALRTVPIETWSPQADRHWKLGTCSVCPIHSRGAIWQCDDYGANHDSVYSWGSFP